MKKYLIGSLLLAAFGLSAYAAKEVVKPMPVVSTRTMALLFGDGVNQNCTSSPCVIFGQNGFVKEVTRNAAGDYSVVMADGNFSAIPACTCNAHDPSLGNTFTCGTQIPGTNSLNVRVVDDTGTQVDAFVQVLCAGI